MPTSRKKMALLNGLDQYSAYYSVICVFGSVVGCVVVPLITQVGSFKAPALRPFPRRPGCSFRLVVAAQFSLTVCVYVRASPACAWCVYCVCM